LICQKGSEQLSTIVIEVISSYCFNVRHAVCELWNLTQRCQKQLLVFFRKRQSTFKV